jgi:hypothetical protein
MPRGLQRTSVLTFLFLLIVSFAPKSFAESFECSCQVYAKTTYTCPGTMGPCGLVSSDDPDKAQKSISCDENHNVKGACEFEISVFNETVSSEPECFRLCEGEAMRFTLDEELMLDVKNKMNECQNGVTVDGKRESYGLGSYCQALNENDPNPPLRSLGRGYYKEQPLPYFPVDGQSFMIIHEADLIK